MNYFNYGFLFGMGISFVKSKIQHTPILLRKSVLKVKMYNYILDAL